MDDVAANSEICDCECFGEDDGAYSIGLHIHIGNMVKVVSGERLNQILAERKRPIAEPKPAS